MTKYIDNPMASIVRGHPSKTVWTIPIRDDGKIIIRYGDTEDGEKEYWWGIYFRGRETDEYKPFFRYLCRGSDMKETVVMSVKAFFHSCILALNIENEHA